MKNTSKNSYFFLLVSFVVTALLVGMPAYAQVKTAQDLTSEIDKIFSWATPSSPGCTVAASQNGKLVVNRAYGSADLERDVPITTSTIFDIGSTQKLSAGPGGAEREASDRRQGEPGNGGQTTVD